MPSMPERCEPKLTAEMAKAAVAAIDVPEIEHDLVRRIVDADTKVANYRRLIDRGNELERFLSQAKF